MKRIIPFFVFISVFVQSFAQGNSESCSEFSSQDFRVRRENLRKAMPENGVAVFFAAPKRRISGDLFEQYQQNSNFEYLTGYKFPHSILLVYKTPIEIEGRKVSEVLFYRSPKKFLNQWEGKKPSLEEIKKRSGIQCAIEGHQIYETNLLPIGNEKVFLSPSPLLTEDLDSKDNEDLFSLVRHFKLKLNEHSGNVDEFELKDWMASLRFVKSEQEICRIETATSKTVDGLRKAIEAIDTGNYEYQIQAEFEFQGRIENCKNAFPTMVASGSNSCIIQYQENQRKIENGDLVVIDGGLNWKGYGSDVCRTVPANGQFSPEQKQIYKAVLKAQKKAIESCKPGGKFWTPHQIATEVIQEELIKLGIINKPYQVRAYFMHGTAHYVGMDVHDPGTFNTLKEGNVVAIEPGIYIPEGSNCDPKWWNIGVRIEDVVLVQKEGFKVLSAGLPKSIVEIEKMMNKKK